MKTTRMLKERNISQCRGFSLVELLVVIAVVLLLAAIFFPVFSVVRASSERAACISNLRQIGALAALYRAESGGVVLPYAVTEGRYATSGGLNDSANYWPQQLAPYIDRQFFHTTSTGTLRELSCPTAMRALNADGPKGFNPTYAMFGSQNGVRFVTINNPGNKVYIGDSPWSGQRSDWNGSASRAVSFSDTDVKDPRGIIFRHRGEANFLFHDGRVASYGNQKLPLPPTHAATSHEYRSMFDWTY